MNNEIRERYLKLALVVSGTAFLLIYPLCLVWPSGWVWHGGEGSYYFANDARCLCSPRHFSDCCCKESCTKP